MCAISPDAVVKASSLHENIVTTKTTKVVSHVPNNIKEPSYAILSHDHLAKLPSSFTICSSIMTPFNFPKDELVFFDLLGKEGNYSVLKAMMKIVMTREEFSTVYNWKQQWKDLENDGKEFLVFSHKWIKNCAALNRSSGLHQFVADGIFVANGTLSELKLGNMSTDLSGKLFLGVHQMYGASRPAMNKVTNLNIFSTAHSVEVMRQNTQGGMCIEDGDYLAWKDMEWTLHGQAVIETVDAEQPCVGQPFVDVYPAEMDQQSCMYLCENLGSRAPSIMEVEEWKTLHDFLKQYRGGFPMLWVAIDDNKNEDQWQDYYTHNVLNHTEAWFPWAPNMGNVENCAVLIKTTSGLTGLDDTHCDFPMSCMCEMPSILSEAQRSLQ